jgi:hypothetical protein
MSEREYRYFMMKEEVCTRMLYGAGGSCVDQRYLLLRRKPLAAMSDREYDYLMLKDEACMRLYLVDRKREQVQAGDEVDRGSRASRALIGVGIPLLAVAVPFVFLGIGAEEAFLIPAIPVGSCALTLIGTGIGVYARARATERSLAANGMRGKCYEAGLALAF